MSARIRIISVAAPLLSGVLSLLVCCSPASAHYIDPTGELAVEVGETFQVAVHPSGGWDDCLVAATVTSGNPAVVSGGGSKTESEPVFEMTALAPGSVEITIFYDGVGDQCTSVQTETLTVTVTGPKSRTSGGAPCSGTVGDPVNTYNGELFFHEPADLWLGGPLPLSFQRYYASYLRRNFVVGDLGDNWRHNFEWSVHWNGNHLALRDQIGRKVRWTSDGAGTWTQQSGLEVPYQIRQDNGEIVIFDPESRLVYTFSEAGKLTRIRDGNGNAHTLVYDGQGRLQAVADGLGRTLRFSYSTVGALVKLTTVSEQRNGLDKRSVSFRYDASGDNLLEVVDARSRSTTYAYALPDGADRGALWYKTFPRGNVHYRQTYYTTADGANSGRARDQTDAYGNRFVFTYDGDDTMVADPNGNTSTHTHTEAGQLTAAVDEAGRRLEMGSDEVGRRISLADRLGGTTTHTRDAVSGYHASATSADGTEVAYEHASRELDGFEVRDLVAVDHPDGSTESFTRDASGNVASYTDQAGEMWTYTHNAYGQVLTVTNSAGGVTTYTYHADGSLASRQDHWGHTTLHGYDDFGRLATVTRPDGTTREFTYDELDNLLTIRDERGQITTFTYDDNGNLGSLRDALGRTVTYGYDDMDRLARVTDPLGNSIAHTYDALGRLMTTRDRSGATTAFAHDARGRLVSSTNDEGRSWTREYDDEGILAAAAAPLAASYGFDSDEMGRIIRITSPKGRVTQLGYDEMGRVIETEDPLGQVATRAYDARGLLTAHARGAVTAAFVRNVRGQITTITDPNGSEWRMAYDVEGRMTSTTDPLANTVTFEYDSRDRVSRKSLPLGTLEINYDATDNVVRELYSDGTDLAYEYDAIGRLTRAEGLELEYGPTGQISSSNGLAISRDEKGRISEIVYGPGKAVAYRSYDSGGRILEIVDWLGGATTLSYGDSGHLSSLVRPNGVTATYAYDDEGFLTGIEETTPQGQVSSIQLTRDDLGRVTSAQRALPGPTPGLPVIGSRSWACDAASQISSHAYDDLGRLLDDGSRTYTWDLASRLAAYQEEGSQVSFGYDAAGRRIWRRADGVAREYVWNLALALSSVSVIREDGIDQSYVVYVPSGALLYTIRATDGARNYHHFDEMGNVLYLTDDSGAVTATYANDPYGFPLSTSGLADNPFTWQGAHGVMREGDTGLYYLRDRYYDSTAARFISRDRIRSLSPKQINPYQYAMGNPLMNMDPSGLDVSVVRSGIHTDIAIDVWDGNEVVGVLTVGFYPACYQKAGTGTYMWEGIKSIFGGGTASELRGSMSWGARATSFGQSRDRINITGTRVQDQRLLREILRMTGFSTQNQEVMTALLRDLFPPPTNRQGKPVPAGKRYHTFGRGRAGKPAWPAYGYGLYRPLSQACNDFTDAMLDIWFGYNWNLGPVLFGGDTIRAVWEHVYPTGPVEAGVPAGAERVAGGIAYR